MEYRQLKEESDKCLKFKLIENIVANYSGNKSFIAVGNYRIYEIEKVTTTNKAVLFHVGELVGCLDKQGLQLNRQPSTFVEAGRTVRTVVKNGKSVFIASDTRVYEVISIQFNDTTIILGVGDIVGKLVYDRTDIRQSKDNNGDAWFNYN